VASSATAHQIDRCGAVRTLHALVGRVEAESVCSVGHSERVAGLARALALSAGWCRERADRLHEAALVHDVGKIALRREVLGSHDKLTDEEYEHVKSHVIIGVRMVGDVLAEEQTRWISEHHERWDGFGYPSGRRGEEISQGGRLLAIADSFDAMTSPRIYKPTISLVDALAEVGANAGTQFAPDAMDRLIPCVGAIGSPADAGSVVVAAH
jgi:HD-GYP domain-containing protein (c-di-GMP phosphodiesterase class II)